MMTLTITTNVNLKDMMIRKEKENGYMLEEEGTLEKCRYSFMRK